jgi:hypothetical protein
MKTPEELAEEYSNSQNCLDDQTSRRHAFLAGYQAAKDKLPRFHAGADVYIIDANNPLPKPMPLSIAEQNQFADTSKVMNSSNNSNGWISVKDRLPEDHKHYLVISNVGIVQAPVWYNGCPYWDVELAYYSQRYERWMTENPTLKDVPKNKVKFDVTHWMPLPEPPTENSK